MTAPTIIGVDLSLAATGLYTPADGGATVRTDPGHPIESRLQAIRNRVIAAATPGRNIDNMGAGVDLVVIEDFVTRSPAASTLGMVHGVVRVALREAGIPFVLVPPASLKRYIASKGNAKKDEMRMETFKRFGRDFNDDNICDAHGLRAMALDAYGHALVDMPAANRAALEKIDWPQAAGVAA
jgi:Holliday junction resolvasome RuvABC endonuclease subunit